MNNDLEIWRPIVGWEELYEVSSHGRVRSFDRIVRCGYGRTRCMAGKILRAWTLHGYPLVELQDREQGRRRRTFVHRFTCEAFHGPPPSGAHEVAHGDGDPSNGHYLNLRWATHVENEADKKAHGTRLVGERHSMAKLTLEQVRAIKSSAARTCDLGRQFNVSPATIHLIRKGKNWREAGLHAEAA